MAKGTEPTFISRGNQRRDLLSLLTGLKPGEEISYEEVEALTGLKWDAAGDKGLMYDVREHCRDVGGFIIEVQAKKGMRRATDNDVATKTIDRRRDRILRQSLRGAAESVAIGDLSGLDALLKHRLLSHQAIFGTIALASTLNAVKAVSATVEQKKLAEPPDPEIVIAAARKIRQ